MWTPFRSRRADVLSHWYTPVPHFTASTEEFYAAVENELKVQKVPGLELFRVEFSEGGLLSDKRTYLRMTRERFVFDICAAPFGSNYFFSCRFAEFPVKVSLFANGKKIDVALEKANRTIACEISIMTTVDHEVGNVAKCLKAGCHHVAVICTNETRLTKIQSAVCGQ